MRAFSTSQGDTFLKAFGQTIKTSTGAEFTAIVEAVPVSIDTGGGYVEGIENYITFKTVDLIPNQIHIGTEIVIETIEYEIYNIVDDLSGMVNAYFRTKEGQSFAEDY
ncbi:hypothetical protein [Erwinia sp. JH02]|uniref:hypothetical protein n=1 Tax=unclassified Erwinia TaxID=2622719 RepID=UPI0014899AAC|nr:hypothetical protein [Erwinia sp. JH02]NNS06211.1 hypothetical protein [Erwinia sp. JH02]